MAPVGRDAFLAELRALPADRRAAFLAALYEARGRRVERDGTRLRIGAPDDLTVLVPDGDPPAAERLAAAGVDAVLALDDEGTGSGRPSTGGVARIDGHEVHRAALYAIDRSDCERLLERFFGRSLASFDDGDGRRDRDIGSAAPDRDVGSAASTGSAWLRGAGGTERTGRGAVHARRRGGASDSGGGDAGGTLAVPPWLRPIAAVALVAILALALASSGAVPGTGDRADPAAGAAGTGTLTPLTPATPTVAGPTAVSFDDVERTPGAGDTVFDVGSGTPPAPSPTAEPPAVNVTGSVDLPPGISPSGEIDEAALAAAHLRALANRSFRLVLVSREFDDGRPTGVHREVIRVESAARYRVDTYGSGEFRTTPVVLEGGDVYANGSAVVRRAGGDRPGPLPRGDEIEPGSDGPVPYGDSLGQYLRWFLSVEESTLAGRATVDGHPAYWLTIDGDPWIESANTTGSALVTRDGTVRELRRAHDVPDHPGTSVVVTIRVTDVGSTTVRPPAWYGSGEGTKDRTENGTENGTGTEAGGTGTPTATPTSTPAESGDAGEDRRTEG